MEDGMSDGARALVERFAQLVRTLTEQAPQIKSPGQVRQLEGDLRVQGRTLLRDLLGHVLQTAVDHGQEGLRTCPHCGRRRRHQGVRPRTLDSSLGQVGLRGIYWKCPCCPSRQHSVELVDDQQITRLLKDLLLLAGVSSTSFDKAQVVSRELLGVDADDEAIRQLCLQEGWRAQVRGCPPVEPGGELVGSCDGTMVHTREDRWREVKALHFAHAGGCYGGAWLENAQAFTPRLHQVAQQLGQDRAGRCVFVSDCAEWISHGVQEHLPGFLHVADYFHACQHLHTAAEVVYGRGHPRAQQWSRSISRRLREQGAARLSDKLRRLALFYRDLEHQRAVLDLCKYLDKHASKMDYPRFERQKITIDSGAMESFCKQQGLRLKGPGMRWSVRNVTAMATLVSRWAVDPAHAFTASPAAA